MPPNFTASIERTRKVNGQALTFYVRLFDWALDAQTILAPGVLGSLFPRLRPPKLPSHAVALWCLLRAPVLCGRQCPEAGRRAHALSSIGMGTF